MSSAHVTSHDSIRAVRDTIRTNAGLFTAHGVILVLLGVAAVVWPQVSSLAVDAVVGWLFLVSGVVGLMMMFYAADVAGFFWSLLTAALELFVGVLLLWHPAEGVVTLTLVLIAFFITEGVFQIAGAIVYRSAFPDSWGWMLFSGVIDLVLAGLIIAGWPGSFGWALGLIVGVNLISSGMAIVMVASATRKIAAAIR